MAQKQLLALVGYHEKKVLDGMLNWGVQEAPSGNYDGIILTGMSNTVQNRENSVYVADEIEYMRAYIERVETGLEIVDEIPSMTLMGNIRNVLTRHPKNVTFFVDGSHRYRAERIFLPYFEKTMPGIGDVSVESPLFSFREGTNYHDYSKGMDKVYEIALATPVVSKLAEAFLCGDNPVSKAIITRKSRLLQEKERVAELKGFPHIQ